MHGLACNRFNRLTYADTNDRLAGFQQSLQSHDMTRIYCRYEKEITKEKNGTLKWSPVMGSPIHSQWGAPYKNAHPYVCSVRVLMVVITSLPGNPPEAVATTFQELLTSEFHGTWPCLS